MSYTETDRDIENVEAWAKIFADILRLIPGEISAQVLALATKNDEADRAQPVREIDLTEPIDEIAEQNWQVAMKLRSLVIQVLVRRITNNHSGETAAALLFAPHPYGHGSGLLRDYLKRVTTR